MLVSAHVHLKGATARPVSTSMRNGHVYPLETIKKAQAQSSHFINRNKQQGNIKTETFEI